METLESVCQNRCLRAGDFVSFMSKMEPVSQELEEEYLNWFMKTPMGKKWTQMLKNDSEPNEDGGKGKGGGKGKKK